MQIHTGIPIISLDDLDAILEKNGPSFYRGQSSVQHQLLPTLTRQIKTLQDAEQSEVFIWNKVLHTPEILKICGYDLKTMTIRQEWELMAQCRHAGLLSRMMDLTSKSIVAAWFACSENYDSDAILWEIQLPIHATLASAMQQHPYEINEMKLIYPDIYSTGESLYNTESHKNAMHQWSRLLIQPMKDAIIPLNNQEYCPIDFIGHIIPKEYKRGIYDEISAIRENFILAPNNELEQYVEVINKEVKEKFGIEEQNG